ncbi:MAG TPA: ABC transporter permease [Dyella sp.]|nr:ABC transporter permease [Dyella sp.]
MFKYYLQLAARSLQRNAVLTALMVMAMGFGVASSMTTYSLFRAVSGDPIPWKSSKLFFPQIDASGPLHRRDADEPNDVLTYVDAVALMQDHRARLQTALYPIKPTVTTSKRQRAIPGHAVYREFFPMLDIAFSYGAGWSAAEDEHHAMVAVISKGLNQRLFGGTNSVGKTIQLNARTYTVVGVLADWHPRPKFYDLANVEAFGADDQVFIPFTTAIDQQMATAGGFGCSAPPRPGFAGTLTTTCYWIGYMVELDSAQEVEAYRAYLDHYARDQQSAGRFGWPPDNRLHDLQAWMTYEKVVPPPTKVSLVVALCLLLVCMVNTVGLLLAKFMTRYSDIAVRRAMGASRRAIAVQYCIESGVIGLVGGLLALALTWLGLSAMRHVLPTQIAILAHLDFSLLWQTLCLAITATVIAGLYPVWRATHASPFLQLKED